MKTRRGFGPAFWARAGTRLAAKQAATRAIRSFIASGKNQSLWIKPHGINMERANPIALPTNGHGQTRAKLVGVKQLFVDQAVLMHQPRDLHVVTAVFGDLEQFALLIP